MGDCARLRWWCDNAGFHTFPLSAPELQAFREAPPGPCAIEQGVLPPVFFAHLHDLAQESSEMVSFAALLCIRVLVSSLRCEHTQRVARHGAKSTQRMEVFEVVRGATGAADRLISVPVFTAQGLPT